MEGTWDFITEDYLSILYKSKGEYNFKTDFRLHFSFDRQKQKHLRINQDMVLEDIKLQLVIGLKED